MTDRVIFIDDDEFFLQSMKRYFSAAQLGWRLDFWSNELSALERLRIESNAVIVVDWQMPHLDGIAFCNKARNIAQEKHLRFHFIMLTGNIGPDSSIDALEAGADDYLTKPVELDSLRAHINLGLSMVNASA